MTNKRNDLIESEVWCTGLNETKNTELDEERAALSQLTDTFFSVHYVDLTRDYLHNWKNADEYEDVFGAVGQYSLAMESYIKNNVAKDDQARCLKQTSPDNIRKEFETRSRFSVEMTDVKLGTPRTLVFEFIRVGCDNNRFVMCSKDISEAIDAEKQLQNELKTALDSAVKANQQNEILYSFLKRDSWTFTNDAGDINVNTNYSHESAERTRDYLKNENTWTNLIHPEDRKRVLAAHEKCINDKTGQTPYDIEYRIKRLDGKYHWVRVVARIRIKPDGSRELYGIGTNIDDIISRFKVEEQLSHFRSFGNMINAGPWTFEINIKNKKIKALWSNEFRHMLGFTDETDFPDTLEAFSSRLHPDDKEYAVNSFKEWIFSPGKSNTNYIVEYRIRRKTGEYVWYRDVGKVEPIDDDRCRVYGILIDISLEKDLEEVNNKLADANESLTRRMVISDYFLSTFYSAYYINYVTDEIDFLHINGKAEAELKDQFTSYSHAIGWYIDTFVHPDDKEMMRKALSSENLQRELSKSREFSFTYRKVASDYSEIMRCIVIRGDDDQHAAFGFKIITDEVNDIIVRRNEEDRLHHIQVFGDMVNAGLWSIDFNEKNEVVKVVWTPEFRHMFGFTDENDFPNTKEAWSSRLHPDDIGYTLADFDKCAKSHDTSHFVYNLKYRICRKTGEYKWYHAIGRMEQINENTRRMYGIIIDISTEKELEEANERLVAKNKEITQSKVISDFFLNSFYTAYYVDLQNDKVNFLHFSTEGSRRDVDGKLNTYTGAISWYIDTYTYQDDKKWVAKVLSKENIKRELAKAPSFSFNYRKIIPEGTDTIRCLVIRGEDENHAAIGFNNITDEILEERRQAEKLRKADEARKFLENFADRYRLAFRANLNDNSFSILKVTDGSEMAKYSFTSLSEAKEICLSNYVYPADKEMMAREMDTEYVRKRLSQTPTYNVQFRFLKNDVGIWNEMSVTSIGNDDIAVGFIEKEEEIFNERMHQVILKESEGVCVVNLDMDQMKIFKATGFLSGNSKVIKYSEMMNKLAARLTGDARKHIEELADCNHFRNLLMRNGKSEFIYQSPNFGDVPVWIRVESSIFSKCGDIPETVLVRIMKVDDLQREKIELNNRIAEQKVELEKALVLAEAANKSKSAFLFSMSHDIRTPMNAILGFTNMALKNLNNTNKVVDYLEKSKVAGNLLLSLINSVLDMSRIESGNAKLDEVACDVMRSFVDIEGTMQEIAKAKDIRLSFDFGEVKNRYVYADIERGARVFLNVISNAVKYTKEGGYVKVFCEQTGVEGGRGIYRYTVEDNGIGMSEEFQKHAFEEFTREETVTVSGIQGTGLGLSVCKSFVTLMGGTIECTSKQGVGTTFTITLPFRLQEEGKCEYVNPVTKETASDATPEVQVDFTGKRVLLVEDNEMNREIAVDILEDAGLVVESAEDGAVAVKMVEENGIKYYDFILMDIQMPVMDGYEATKFIRSMYGADKIPIIAVSANAFEEDRRASLAVGMNDHIPKPIDVKVLMACMAKYLK